ncbi:hypothetical protein [Streptococcus suis]|uniref:hypothetical protein n=1 Tax=Streptococcus suis TaxID=1307 RepID=UPI000945D360|nr:hypothetical protein [Streptococcus suis]
MSKKIVLSWLCVASTICSLAVNGKQILAEDVASQRLPTSEQIISDSSETTSLSTETVVAETEVAVTSQSVETSPATTASPENEMVSEVVEETAEPSSEVETPKQEAFSTLSMRVRLSWQIGLMVQCSMHDGHLQMWHFQMVL